MCLHHPLFGPPAAHMPVPMPLQSATSAPLIERSIERATGIVFNITGGRDLTIQEVGVLAVSARWCSRCEWQLAGAGSCGPELEGVLPRTFREHALAVLATQASL